MGLPQRFENGVGSDDGHSASSREWPLEPEGEHDFTALDEWGGLSTSAQILCPALRFGFFSGLLRLADEDALSIQRHGDDIEFQAAFLPGSPPARSGTPLR